MPKTKTQVTDFLLENFNGKTPAGAVLNKKEGSLPYDLLSSVGIYGGGTKDGSIIGLENRMEKLPYEAFLHTTTTEIGIIEGAKEVGVYRKENTKSSGNVYFTGIIGTVIQRGTKVSVGDLIFETQESKTMDATEVMVLVQAQESGEKYNVTVDSINTIVDTVEGLTSVTNKEPFIGGANLESLKDLKTRALYVKRNPPINGNVSFYKLLAENELEGVTGVDGVKSARVFSAYPNAGDVTIVITNLIGEPASQLLVNQVQAVMDIERFLTANPIVESATSVIVDVEANLILADTVDATNVIESLTNSIREYFRNVFENGKVKVSNTGDVNIDYKFLVSWSEVGNIIFDDSGTSGFTNLKLNGVTSDFILSDKQTPILGTVTFN